jgi:hypothetical protein
MKKIYILGLLLTGLYACEKREVPEPDLGISVEKTTYAVGEPVVFKFDGTSDLLTFYSGEAGKEFKNRERVKVDGNVRMNFTSFRQPAFSGPDTTLRIFASTNFKGIYNPDQINAAKWTEITSRATLSTGTDNTPSGFIDLSDLTPQDSALYLAFRYSAAMNTTAAQPNWTIKSLNIENVISAGPPEQKITVRTIANLSWASVSFMNLDNNWTSSTTQLQFIGGAVNTERNLDWIVSQPIDLKRVARDVGVSIKTDPKLKLNTYSIAYTKAGTYTATFEVLNVNKYDSKAVLKEFVITVE